MTSFNGSEVQTLNFTAIALVRDAAREDLAAACCRFGLSKELLQRISTLTHSDVLSLVTHAGEEPLFVPRGDLSSLLTAHPSVLPVLTISPKRHAVSSAAAN